MRRAPDLRQRITDGTRAAREAHKQASRAAAHFERSIPRLIAARRRLLAEELRHHRQNIRATVDERRQAIARARASLREYIEQQKTDLRRHKLEAAAALRAYRLHLDAAVHYREGRLAHAHRALARATATNPTGAAKHRARQSLVRARTADIWDAVRANLEGDRGALLLIGSAGRRADFRRGIPGWSKLHKEKRIDALTEAVQQAVHDGEARELLEREDRRAQSRGAKLAAAEQRGAPRTWRRTVGGAFPRWELDSEDGRATVALERDGSASWTVSADGEVRGGTEATVARAKRIASAELVTPF